MRIVWKARPSHVFGGPEISFTIRKALYAGYAYTRAECVCEVTEGVRLMHYLSRNQLHAAASSYVHQ